MPTGQWLRGSVEGPVTTAWQVATCPSSPHSGCWTPPECSPGFGSSVSSRHSTPVVASMDPAATISSTRRRSTSSASHGQSTRHCCTCSSVVSGTTSAVRSPFLRGSSETHPNKSCVPLRTPRARANTARNCSTNCSSAPLSTSPTTICMAGSLTAQTSMDHARVVLVRQRCCARCVHEAVTFLTASPSFVGINSASRTSGARCPGTVRSGHPERGSGSRSLSRRRRDSR